MIDGRPDLVREAGGRVRRGRGDHGLDPHHGLELGLGQISASAHCAVTCWSHFFLSPITLRLPPSGPLSFPSRVTLFSYPRLSRAHSVYTR